MDKVTPVLMFQDGKAEEAMNYYTSLIEDSKIANIVRYVQMKVEMKELSCGLLSP